MKFGSAKVGREECPENTPNFAEQGKAWPCFAQAITSFEVSCKVPRFEQRQTTSSIFHFLYWLVAYCMPGSCGTLV